MEILIKNKILGLALVLFFLPAFAHAGALGKPSNNLGLVGYWSFDEGTSTVAADHSGKGNTGILSGATLPTWVAGKHGKALNLSGNNSYVNVSGLAWTPTAFTVTWWIKPNTCTSYNQRIEATNGWNAFDAHTTSACEIYVGTDVATRFTPSDLPANTVTLNTWQYFTYTYNGTQGRFYKNGVLIAGPKTQTSPTAWGGFTVGRTDTDTINGLVDDVRVYSRAISATEVTNLYQAGGAKVGTPTAKGTLANGLVGWWTMDGSTIGSTVQDSSGQGNNGYIGSGGPATSTMKIIGKLGQALLFNGSTSFVDISNSSSVADNLQNFSASAWFKIPRSFTGDVVIISKFDSGALLNGTGWALCVSGTASADCNLQTGNHVGALIQSPGNAYYFGYSTASVADNKWHHAVMVVTNGNTSTLYLDSQVQPFSSSGTLGSYSNSSNIRIGNDYNSQLFPGLIDDARVYNRALTAAEVKQLYNQGLGTTANKSSTTLGGDSTLASGLVGLWTFDGPDVTDKVYDRSGQGNNGYVAGGQATSSMKTIGKLGQALKSSPGYISVADASSLNPTAAVSISVWAKSNVIGVGQVVSKYDSISGLVPYEIQFWSTGNIYGNFNTSGGGISSMNCPYSANTLYHIVATYDGTIARLYLNGTQCATQSVSGTIVSSAKNLYIGSSGAQGTFNGTIDDARVYNRALTAGEVKQLYLLGK